jgi:hypothetical protein
LTRRLVSIACTALAAVLLLLGILAGLTNHNVLDGDRFAHHVDSMRRDPAVTELIATEITDQTLAADPDLVAVRPLVSAAATAFVGSSAFSTPFRAAVSQVHTAFTTPGSGQVVLRLADVGAVLAGVLPSISPQAAALLPADLDVTLAKVGSQSFAARTIHLTRVVGLLAWLLPVLALAMFLIAFWVAPDRPRLTIRIGWAVVVAGFGVGLFAVVLSIISANSDETTLRGVLVGAGWRAVSGSVWKAAAITVVAGGLLVVAASARIPQFDLGVLAGRAWALVIHRPARRRTQLLRGVALAAVGAAAALRPGLFFGVVGVLIGLTLFIAGVGEIARTAGARPTSDAAASRSRRWVIPGVVALSALLVVGLVAVEAAPVTRGVSGPAAASTVACNGHVELCDRPYNEVAFPATHNSMSAADEPGWFIPEQPTGLIGQLNAGIRTLLIDTWYGQRTQNSGLIATAPQSHAAALAEANQLYGPSVITSALRVRDAITTKPTGPVEPYLCHTLCEIGATLWEPVMAQVRTWLADHPREVVTFFIQDAVTPASTAAVFDQAGLLPFVHTQQPGQPWPTLGQMIDSGQRIVVLMENHSGGTEYPWQLPGFDYTQDTPYSNPTVASLTCTRNRGTASSPLLLLNYWLSGFGSLVSNARTINAYRVLAPYAEQCRQERDMIPNFVAVNFYDQGDLFRVVDELNGVP